MNTEIITLDLNDMVSGKVELRSFSSKLQTIDFSQYRGKHVQLAGCAPTWAHLLVAARLIPIVSQLDFFLDDGKAGQAIEISRH